jgi:predicted CoA-substrate-specific enzyme activase
LAVFLGIDIGSVTSKAVLTKDGNILASQIMISGTDYRLTAQKLKDEILASSGMAAGEITRTVTTGRGAGLISFSDQQVSDMLCCARGIHCIFPLVRAVIDVQGQSSQVIKLDENGRVIDFAVTEMCAAGSGRFLEVIGNVLQIELKDIGPLSLKSTNPVAFTTGCAVFGESEAISRVSEGIPKEDILAGVNKALANTIFALVERVGLTGQCAISGGGGLNVGLIKSLEDLGIKLLVPPRPQIVNALGAAIIAKERAE